MNNMAISVEFVQIAQCKIVNSFPYNDVLVEKAVEKTKKEYCGIADVSLFYAAEWEITEVTFYLKPGYQNIGNALRFFERELQKND